MANMNGIYTSGTITSPQYSMKDTVQLYGISQ